MATQSTTPPKDKREAIIEAMLDLVVERGFHDAPMSLLAKRSGASAGVIYHYFASKDEVIHAVYMHVKSMKLQSMLDGQAPNASFKEAFLQMYINAYKFYRTHLRETRFLDLYENSTFCVPTPAHEASALNPEIAEFMKSFRPKSEGGVLKNLPLAAIYEFSFGTSRHLAKKDQIFDDQALKSIALSAWTAISDD